MSMHSLFVLNKGRPLSEAQREYLASNYCIDSSAVAVEHSHATPADVVDAVGGPVLPSMRRQPLDREKDVKDKRLFDKLVTHLVDNYIRCVYASADTDTRL